MVEIGKKVKNFKIAATGDKDISMNDFKGKNLVLYFYPRDSTPGCTTEGQDFRDAKARFTRRIPSYLAYPETASNLTKIS